MNMNEKKSAFIAKIAEKDSAAQETEIAAMVNWGKASSRQEALEMIKAHPGEDFADIAGSVLHGIPFQEALDETDFTRVKEASATEILGWLDNIHTAWVFANISPNRLVFKSFVRTSSASIVPQPTFRGMKYLTTISSSNSTLSRVAIL